jgi:hypothetical protein
MNINLNEIKTSNKQSQDKTFYIFSGLYNNTEIATIKYTQSSNGRGDYIIHLDRMHTANEYRKQGVMTHLTVLFRNFLINQGYGGHELTSVAQDDGVRRILNNAFNTNVQNFSGYKPYSTQIPNTRKAVDQHQQP